MSAASHSESAPVATGHRSGNRSVPASDRQLPSPKGARSYSPGRSAAQAWDPGPTPSICPKPQRGVTMCGRDNVRPESDNPGATDALALSRPFRAFVDSRLRQPGAAQGCAPGYRIRPLQGRERHVSAASHPESAPVATVRWSGNRSVPASDRQLPSPKGRDPIARVGAQRRPGIRGPHRRFVRSPNGA